MLPLSEDNIVEIERRFTADRAQLPALFIATPSERENSVWTKEAPNLTILARVAFLASESLKVLQSYYVAVIPSEVNMWKVMTVILKFPDTYLQVNVSLQFRNANFLYILVIL